MQYCSLQHRTLLPSPVTSTTGCCFCFGFISSFFLELLLQWSPVAYWAPTNLGSSSFSVLSFCFFMLFMGFSRQQYRKVKESESEVSQSCPTLCDPMDCSLPGSSIHGIFQARILEWVTISFSRRSSQLRDWTWVCHIVGRCFTFWATREAEQTAIWPSKSHCWAYTSRKPELKEIQVPQCSLQHCLQ